MVLGEAEAFHMGVAVERLKRAADTVRGTLSARDWMRWLSNNRSRKFISVATGRSIMSTSSM